MIHSLRNKLAVSHTLPILLLMPLLSLFLLYSLENFFTQNLLQQLTYQARLASHIVEGDPSSLESAAMAERLMSKISSLTDARVLLLSENGTILASTREEDRARLGTIYDDPSVMQALRGKSAQGIGQGFFAEVAYVVLPLQSAETVLGALRVSYEVTDLRSEFSQLQRLILGGVAITALLALGLGLGLAETITRPLHDLADRAQLIAKGNYNVRAPAGRRDEVGTLVHSFNTMAARLEELEHTRRRQIAAITHELARPLTGMRAAIETLQDGGHAKPEVRDPLLAGVREELGRMQRLVEQLQRVQKRTLRPMELHREQVELDRVIRATVSNYEALAEQSHITLTPELPHHLAPVYADQDRLIQVLTNLLDNAFKFTPAGGQVTVRAGESDEQLWVSVADTGIGIAAEELPKLFQEFYRGGSSHPAEKQGMGLGLTIASQIIRAHGGTLHADSEPGRGARFTFFLPKEPL
jgi:signal transduction histidine kinase